MTRSSPTHAPLAPHHHYERSNSNTCTSQMHAPPIEYKSIKQPSTPLQYEVWRTKLEHHPNRAMVQRILSAISHGANINYTGDRHTSRAHVRNLPTASEAPDVIDAALAKEVADGRMAGPMSTPPPHIHVSPVGLVPKKVAEGAPRKWRVIHHLSYPHGDPSSINASVIDMPLRLSRIDDAMTSIKSQGHGALLIKIDIAAAYRCVPIRREDWPLLGIKWRDHYYMDMCLPFGLKSSCAIWEDIAAAAEWIIRTELGLTHVHHYVDDFIIILDSNMDNAMAIKQRIITILSSLGLPLATDKLEGPSTCLTYLGYELDTVAMQTRITATRVTEIHDLCHKHLHQPRCTRTELQSLIGKLAFAARVVRPARMYLRRLLEQLKATRCVRSIKLGDRARSDLTWWLSFLHEWNGITIIPDIDWCEMKDIALATDASLHGAGAIFGHLWWTHAWTEDELAAARMGKSRESMPYLELRALVMACATWGHLFAGRKIKLLCDCEPVVMAANTLKSDTPAINDLLRTLFHISATQSFIFHLEHMPGITNTLADALSRGKLQVFRDLLPTASPSPTKPSLLPIQL